MLLSNSLFRALVRTRSLSSNVPATTGNNSELNPRFVNRNPRNLEQMLLAKKPVGFEWDVPSRNFWYRLDIEISLNYIRGKIIHNEGSTVVRAFSGEWGIKKQIVSTTDQSAAYNVGRVLARRCLEAGLVAVHHETPLSLKNSKRAQSFLKGFTEEGVLINEPDAEDEVEDRPVVTMYR